MTACEIMAEAKRRGIRLLAKVDRVRCEAPRGAMTPELRDAVVRQKSDLLAILWRLEAMRRLAIEDPRPAVYAVGSARGGPGRCFSCGDALEHPDAYGRCTPCDVAADLFYADKSASGDVEALS